MDIKESESFITPLQYFEEVFEKLFPAIDRFNICQGTAGDCFFISPLNSLIDTPKGRNEIYKMFTGSTLDKLYNTIKYIIIVFIQLKLKTI